MQTAEATFHKHVYGKERMRSTKSISIPDHRSTAQDQLKEFLGNVRGKGLCVSLMFDSSFQHW